MKEELLKKLLDNKVFAVLRIVDANKALNIVEAILKGGVKNIEFTMSSDKPLECLENVSKEFQGEGIFGMGSNRCKEDVISAVDHGAQFIVSPILKEEIITASKEKDVPVFSGAFSPTEILTASELGSDVVKVFPADILGMKYFKAILAPMPDLKIMPTGGVSLTNAGEWLKAGACAVGIGSALIDNKAISEGNYSVLTENAKTIMNSVKINI